MASRLSLHGKVAIITGAAGGIGSATAELMAERGARLLLADIVIDRAEDLARRLRDRGIEASAYKLDLTEESSIQQMVTTCLDQFGRVDILHNNAADLSPDYGARDRDIGTMPTDVWDRAFQVNVRGTMIACRETLPALVETRGSIVNMASSTAIQGHLMLNAYSSSKAAIVHMTKCIATSHGTHGVRCNAVAPGLTLTPAIREPSLETFRQAAAAETLIGRLGDPEDIAEVVAFLASEAARNITGEMIVADGGASVHVSGIAQMQGLGPV